MKNMHMQKLLLILITLTSSQVVAMQSGTISARVTSTAVRLGATKVAKRTNTSVVHHLSAVWQTPKHMEYIQTHENYLAQQLRGIKPLDTTEIAIRAALLSNIIKQAEFLTWEQATDVATAHVQHTILAEKSAMLNRRELVPVIHACRHALAAEVPLFSSSRTIKFPFAPGFAIYPFRFGAGLKLYNTAIALNKKVTPCQRTYYSQITCNTK